MSKSSDNASNEQPAHDQLRQGFQQYFDTPGVALPDPIPPRGVVEAAGWHVAYLRDEDDKGQPYLDFFAENRHSNSRHVRITATGESIALENYQEALIFPPGEDDWNKASVVRDANNREVTAILKAKGLLADK